MDWKVLVFVSQLCLFSFASSALAASPTSTSSPTKKTYSFTDMLEESLFGDPTDPWRPLPLGTIFNEGWDEPFDYPTNGSGGAPRQGWINSYDGVFYRLWFLSYSHSHDFNDNGNQDIGSYTLFAPISRRLQIRFDIPFIVSNRGGAGNNYNNNFGDVVFSPRLLLAESQDASHIFAVQMRTPTGQKENGNDLTNFTPQYEFWANVYRAWVVRGGIGFTLPAKSNQGRHSFNYNFAIGTYLTPHDQTPFGDLTVYLAADGFSTTDNRASDVDFFSLTPGFRSHMGRDWYLLGGIEVPLTGPDSASFDYEPTVWLMKVF